MKKLILGCILLIMSVVVFAQKPEAPKGDLKSVEIKYKEQLDTVKVVFTSVVDESGKVKSGTGYLIRTLWLTDGPKPSQVNEVKRVFSRNWTEVSTDRILVLLVYPWQSKKDEDE